MSDQADDEERARLRRLNSQALGIDENNPQLTLGHSETAVVFLFKQYTTRLVLSPGDAIRMAMVLLQEALAVEQIQHAKKNGDDGPEGSRLILPH